MFRNVGIQQSDAGEIPKIIHTRLKTRRKFEIKNSRILLRISLLSLSYIYIIYIYSSLFLQPVVLEKIGNNLMNINTPHYYIGFLPVKIS